jgi:hypothetical protein
MKSLVHSPSSKSENHTPNPYPSNEIDTHLKITPKKTKNGKFCYKIVLSSICRKKKLANKSRTKKIPHNVLAIDFVQICRSRILGSQILTFQHLLRPHHGNGADLQASLQSQKIQTSWPHHAKKSDSASINFNSHIINVVHGVASPCKERRVILLLLTLILISLMWLTGWCDHPQVIQGVAGHLMELPGTPVILGFFLKKKN